MTSPGAYNIYVYLHVAILPDHDGHILDQTNNITNITFSSFDELRSICHSILSYHERIPKYLRSVYAATQWRQSLSHYQAVMGAVNSRHLFGVWQALRRRNGKAMEALAETEKRAEKQTRDLTRDLDSKDSRIRDLEARLAASEQSVVTSATTVHVSSWGMLIRLAVPSLLVVSSARRQSLVRMRRSCWWRIWRHHITSIALMTL